MQRVLNDKECARLLGLGVQTLRNWRCHRKGPPYLRIERVIRYQVDDLLSYLKKKKIIPEEGCD
jgi:hypothetical protein